MFVAGAAAGLQPGTKVRVVLHLRGQYQVPGLQSVQGKGIRQQVQGLGGTGVVTSAEFSFGQEQGGFGTYAQIGSALPAGHHNQLFDFDEALLQPAVELTCRVALALDEKE